MDGGSKRDTGFAPKAGAGLRAAAVLLAIVLGIVAAVAAVTMLDVSDKGVCSDAALGGDCYDFSSSAKPFVLFFGWAGGVVTGLAALGALVFTFRGRAGRPVLIATGVGVVLLAISILIARTS